MHHSIIITPSSLPARPVFALDSLLDQILFFSQSISDRFNKPRPGSWTILATNDFLKAFDSVWHPTLLHKLITAGLFLALLVGFNLFFLIGALALVFQNHKSHSFRVRRGVPQGSVLNSVLFPLFINNLPASLDSSVSCSLYAYVLAIWSSSGHFVSQPPFLFRIWPDLE